ncbi:helix-turn-helix domain-containing protein [Galbibacter mesophilus]|uniref:helix-turn-helix domain-containing protein n=1 Tax=Galbibacter mesophilus TaxID=379069 RepID=UPI00191EBEEB|nr:helix-turn-helix domain-containing protein [Galbibacter mesophilus]MCM5663856.1 helix-turn-helix domain-containing protein [Galbibacter mesophilus]
MKIVKHSYTLDDRWIKQLAKELNIDFKNNRMLFEESYAHGNIFFSQATNDISVVLFDLRYYEPVIVSRLATKENLYIIHFDMSEDFNIFRSHGKDYHIGYQNNLGLTYIDGKIPNIFIPKNKKSMFGIRLLVRKKLLNHLIIDKKIDQPYLHHNIDGESRILLKSLKQEIVENPAVEAYLKNTALQLFANFLEKFSKLNNRENKSVEEKHVSLAKNVRQFLLMNLHNPYPGNIALSKEFGISSAKLILIFKEVYKITPFDFFTNEKVLLTHKLLKSGDYKSVASLADELSISNLSHFSKKYESVFGNKIGSDLKKK